MPLYAGYLALFYSPEITDDDYFVVAKRWNIWLSLALLAALAVIFARQLPPLVAANVIAVVAFGYFVFKAGYAQSELLFYFLFFAVFVGFWRVILGVAKRTRRLLMAAGVGMLAALAHLTKAAVLPFLALFVGVYAVAAVVTKRRRGRSLAAEAAVPVVVVVMFLAVLSPYLVNSKQAFGAYPYNVNTTFYAWYDNWAQASVGTRVFIGGGQILDMPADQIAIVGGEVLAVSYVCADRVTSRRRVHGHGGAYVPHIRLPQIRRVVSRHASDRDSCGRLGIHRARSPQPGACRLPRPVRRQPSGVDCVLRAHFGHGHDAVSDRPLDAVLLCRIALSRES